MRDKLYEYTFAFNGPEELKQQAADKPAAPAPPGQPTRQDIGPHSAENISVDQRQWRHEQRQHDHTQHRQRISEYQRNRIEQVDTISGQFPVAFAIAPRRRPHQHPFRAHRLVECVASRTVADVAVGQVEIRTTARKTRIDEK